MNQDQLQQDVVEDEEGFQDFRDAIADYAPKIETLVSMLRHKPSDVLACAELFRSFHSIKGDASLCRLEFLVPFVHAAESVLSRVRSGEVIFSSPIANVLLLTIDRLQLAIELLAARKPLTDLRLVEFASGLGGLSSLPPQSMDAACQRLIGAITGVGITSEVDLMPDVEEWLHDRSVDLAFFHQLALQFESRSSLFDGRTDRNLKLALLTNQLGGSVVDADQLCAAVYLHDVGMMFLPESLWIGGGRLSEEERHLMNGHVGWGAGLLARMPGWEDAADMVLQHHEKLDGSGYPQGLLCDDIVPGAKILALVDAFESVMLKQRSRGQARSLLRAVAEVNASDLQFDPVWVEPFNHAIRHLMDSQD